MTPWFRAVISHDGRMRPRAIVVLEVLKAVLNLVIHAPRCVADNTVWVAILMRNLDVDEDTSRVRLMK